MLQTTIVRSLLPKASDSTLASYGHVRFVLRQPNRIVFSRVDLDNFHRGAGPQRRARKLCHQPS